MACHASSETTAASSDAFDQLCKQAAATILQADIILIAVGAGFSADSGLPVYNDIADVPIYSNMGLDYQDLCDPDWIYDDPSIFYGFWGTCFNLYRNAVAHKGYSILQKWKDTLFQPLLHEGQDLMTFFRKQLYQENGIPTEKPRNSTTSPFFVYSSNVDHHFHRYFHEQEIYEIHGNIEKWQCAGKNRGKQSCCSTLWDIPSSYRFEVDSDTMKANVDTQPFTFISKKSSSLGSRRTDFPSCPKCKAPARPNVLMFRDKQWVPNKEQEQTYVEWEEICERIMETHSQMKFVILEIGCGTRVPSIRLETEMVVKDVNKRCETSSNEPLSHRCTLIRVNKDFPECSDTQVPCLSIHGTALETLQSIDKFITCIMQTAKDAAL